MSLSRNIPELKKQLIKRGITAEIKDLSNGCYGIYCQPDKVDLIKHICDYIGFSVMQHHQYFYTYKIKPGKCIIIY